jgi:predicted 3-demethylubiquinone-9 3-methyltransferase (glyoxalase superfamily)
MQKIIPHFWYDTEAKEAAARYVSAFNYSKIEHITTITGTPSGDADIVVFHLAGQEFMAISAGPFFKLNPSISMFVEFDREPEIEAVWNNLIADGKALMPYDTYPWAQKYGWLQDKYGLSWQLSMTENNDIAQKITPFFMFTGRVAGSAREALETYTAIFPDSHIDAIVPYSATDGDQEGYIKHSRFTLNGQQFMAMDSSLSHDFNFNEAVSLVVNCDTQEEIDYYWEKLSAVPEAEQCGWLKDRFGISWQIVPTVMKKMMTSGHREKTDRVTRAFLKMKKFNISMLEEAYAG